MRRLTSLGVIGIAAAAMFLLPGCFVISGTSSAQLQTIGDVQLTIDMCASNDTDCTNKGNTNSNAPTGDGQALVGLRIPAIVTAPATIISTNTLLSLTQSPSYTAELQRVSPAPAGQKWVGYISQVRSFTTGSSTSFRIQPVFQLPRGADGSPFTTPFLWQAVTGLRVVDGTNLSTRDVVCGPAIDQTDPGATTMCVDSPAPATVATDITRTTRDLGILAGGATASVQPGSLAVLQFQAKYSGTSTAAAAFAITANTSLPGAVASPNTVNFVPLTNQTAPISVLVNVPSNAAPGTYDVNLIATLAAGTQVRTGTGKLTVLPPPAVPVKKLDTKVRYRAILSATRVRLPLLRVVSAPSGTRIRVTCRLGGCSLIPPRIRTSRGGPVDLAGIFANRRLRPGVIIEIRTTRPGFVGRLFRYRFGTSKVQITQCEISLAGVVRKCVRV